MSDILDTLPANEPYLRQVLVDRYARFEEFDRKFSASAAGSPLQKADVVGLPSDGPSVLGYESLNGGFVRLKP